MLQLGLLVLLLSVSQAQVGCLNEEGLALLSFKNSILKDPGGSLDNWNYSDKTPCSWNGVICRKQKVVSLRIPNKKLYGFLPSALGSLSGLLHLNLRSNSFYGPLPAELFQVQGLQRLYLSQNSVNGSLPSSILQCQNLTDLDLSSNNFSGPLPEGFGSKLVSLQRLSIYNNRFNGSIPSDMGNLSSLQGNLNLSHNLFSGSIPVSLGNLPEKVYIDLTYNNLSGPIPQNGALMSSGPTAFIGNPSLCGLPLTNPCSSDNLGASSPSPYPHFPSNNLTQGCGDNAGKKKGRGFSKIAVISIVASSIVGICLVGLLIAFCYTRVCNKSRKKSAKKGRKEWLCFRRDESETPSESMEKYDLVNLDTEVAFDLDELLKASAFVLGKSAIGIMYKIVLEHGLTLAVRRLGEGGSQRFKEFQTEVEAIGKLRHQNIVTLKAYYWSLDEKLLIYEYVPNGSLAAALHGKPGVPSFTPLPWSTRLEIIKGFAKGLVYLHEFSPQKYVHGDLKPSNILLGRSMEPKISNFGLGRLANIARGSPSTLQSNWMKMTCEKPRQSSSAPLEFARNRTVASTMSYYQAPESLKAVKPSQKWDVYSYGLILIEIVTGRSPQVEGATSEMDLVLWIHQCLDDKKPLLDVLEPYLVQDADKEDEIVAALRIAVACVQARPERRPTMKQVLEALGRLSETSD